MQFNAFFFAEPSRKASENAHTRIFIWRLDCIAAGMIPIGLIAGGSGILLALLYPTVVDKFLRSAPKEIMARLRALLEAPPQPDEDLLLTSSLISFLRAGISLDAALDKLATEATPGSAMRTRLRRIQLGTPAPDFLASFLCASLVKGSPAIVGLAAFEKALLAKKKLQLRARGITAQCRAQAEVLSWLPWLLAAAIFVIDSSWFFSASRSALAWGFWAAAVMLGGLGRQWIQRILRSSLVPKSEQERMEEEKVPDFVLNLLSNLSQGIDVESAVDASLASLGCPHFRANFQAGVSRGPISHLRAILHRAAATGAPLRDDLLSFLDSLQGELESRWEERVQRLPVSLLLPLFACFFPSSLLVFAGLLLPLLRQSL